jgi:hypothetical protein
LGHPAPELNLTLLVRANSNDDDLGELDDWVMEYLIELKHTPELLRALWERSDLSFPNPLPDE